MKADKSKLRLAMARACMNPQDLARCAEMPTQTLNGVLRERSVRPATIGKIAKALGVDVLKILNHLFYFTQYSACDPDFLY